MSDYARERSTPGIPACQKALLSLTFDGSHLRGSNGMEFPAVSGKPDKQGVFEYALARQQVAYQGPIPEGDYWIQPSQLWENNWFKSLVRTPRASWGNYRLTIHPYPGTQTYGCGGFFLHGGTVPGSAGCIDLVGQMDRFVSRLKQALGGLPECYVQLYVRYPQH